MISKFRSLNVVCTTMVLCVILLSSEGVQSSSIAPGYFFQTNFNPEANQTFPVEFNQINFNNLDMQTIVQLDWRDVGLEYDTQFFGQVIYYKTGVLYANYWKKIGENEYQSYLLAVNTTDGSLLFKDFKFCEGCVSTDIAIDQQTGDIHYLNHTATFVSGYNEVDWLTWNVESNTTTLIREKASRRSRTYGAACYDSLSGTLYTFYNPIFVIYRRHDPIARLYEADQNMDHLTMNPQTGELYVTTYINSSMSIATIDWSFGKVRVKSMVCGWTTYLGYEYISSPGAADFDYTSNTWSVTLVEAKDSKISSPVNVVFFTNLATCEIQKIAWSSNDNAISMGISHFNSGANY